MKCGITSGVHLPVNPPVLPMLAKRAGELPHNGDWVFEPKWDGFRALVFRDGDEILIQSRDEKPLNRYFPELLEPLRLALPARCVRAQAPGQDPAGVLRIERIAGEANTENAKDEPCAVPEFEVAGDHRRILRSKGAATNGLRKFPGQLLQVENNPGD
jgi:ATP dependent DNA ligase-like protein